MSETEEKVISNKDDGIKSTAIVKYSVPKPAKFLQLQCNTDLNLPPSNWLSNSTESYGLQHILYTHKGFASFRMAHMFPDCVGSVDVVSDAENIKNLLKIPYSKGTISMMVHRVENTLLLDDFDIYRHLLRTSESDWEWLRKFFCEHVESDIVDEERLIFVKDKRRKALRQKHLVSKFLYHSLPQSEGEIEELGLETAHSQGPLLPEPSPSTEVPSSSPFDHKYNRNVVWTFEDIDMLLGTDMPIFGGGTHPCISLRLRDMSKPINVLTGIDYWLDNLMSNVPEVVMCYHLNGLVQKYELVKTEDLPTLKDSKFSPKLIRDVAQSILSFLKSNATKAGHTYWLFKGKDEDVVKLYDLTSLCSKEKEDSEQNPFTISVAMLLYRVARNMKHSSETGQPRTIRMLLKNCLKLLSEEKYPEIATSSHYMLSDLYVPANTNPENPQLPEEDVDEENDIFEENVWYNEDCASCEEEIKLNEEIKCLDLENCLEKSSKAEKYRKPPPIVGSVVERCLQALNHVCSGLRCLQFFKSDKNSQENGEYEIPMAKSDEPIPMSFKTDASSEDNEKCSKKIKKPKNKPNLNALLPKLANPAAPTLPTWAGAQTGQISWKQHLKTLLYEKTILVYAILSEDHYISKNYGASLRCLGLLVRSLQIMRKLQNSIFTLRESCLLGRAGDCCLMMVENWKNLETFKIQFHSNTDEDLRVIEELEKDEQTFGIQISETNTKCVLIYDIRTIEQMLLKAIECYEEAIKLTPSDECLMKRLANCLNEVGSFYSNKAKMATSYDNIRDFCNKSEPYLKRSVEIFEKNKDEPNIALVYTNLGHLHRLLAHANTPQTQERGELTPKEKFHYNKSFTFYSRALQVIGERKHCPSVWDAVKWELSTALFTMASIMHENPSQKDLVEAEREIIEMFQKALKACDLDENNPKFPLHQFRAANIHYRLGSLYHKNIWSNTASESKRKMTIQLCRLNYEKAAKMFFASLDPVNYLTAQMQRFALTEYLSETALNAQSKLKHLQACFEIIVEIKNMVELINNKSVDVSSADIEKFNPKAKNWENFKSCGSLLLLVKQRMQLVLRHLIKICLGQPPINKEAPQLGALYKSCYSKTFRIDKESDFNGFVSVLKDVLEEISTLMQKQS